jgi:hypothetical protein
MTLNTFDEVAATYAGIKPVKSAFGKLHDIRPLDPKRRDVDRGGLMRVVRIDTDTYVLSDGNFTADPAVPWWGEMKPAFDAEDFLHRAPITWRRRDGVETIEVSNYGYATSTGSMRHWFLNRYLPEGVSFYADGRTGKHWLGVAGAGDLYLPLNNTVRPATAAWMTANGMLLPKNVKVSDTPMTITLRRDGPGLWTSTSRVYSPSRNVVSDEKAQYADAIKAFREWALAILPMLSNDPDEIRRAQDEWRAANDGKYQTDLKVAIAVLCTEDHPARLAMLYILALGTEAMRRQWSAPRVTNMEMFRKNFSRELNKLCGWYTKTEV